jgi:hypothetical protein
MDNSVLGYFSHHNGMYARKRPLPLCALCDYVQKPRQICKFINSASGRLPFTLLSTNFTVCTFSNEHLQQQKKCLLFCFRATMPSSKTPSRIATILSTTGAVLNSMLMEVRHCAFLYNSLFTKLKQLNLLGLHCTLLLPS